MKAHSKEAFEADPDPKRVQTSGGPFDPLGWTQIDGTGFRVVLSAGYWGNISVFPKGAILV